MIIHKINLFFKISSDFEYFEHECHFINLTVAQHSNTENFFALKSRSVKISQKIEELWRKYNEKLSKISCFGLKSFNCS